MFYNTCLCLYLISYQLNAVSRGIRCEKRRRNITKLIVEVEKPIFVGIFFKNCSQLYFYLTESNFFLVSRPIYFTVKRELCEPFATPINVTSIQLKKSFFLVPMYFRGNKRISKI